MNKQNNTKFLMATIAALCLLGAFGSTFAKSFLMKKSHVFLSRVSQKYCVSL